MNRRDDLGGGRLARIFEELWGDLVDPRDAWSDAEGNWLPLAAGQEHASCTVLNERELALVRDHCRALAATNEFAINGHENRISYIVGSGHRYRATIKKGLAAPLNLAAEVQQVLDAFVLENQWQRRQQELVRRGDRDGESFLRFFTTATGETRVRFVEPAQIATPQHRLQHPAASYGILTEAHDVETVLAYFIDGEPVDAAEIQHRKAHVDSNVKRGLPLFYPVRKNLRRAEKLLRNMSIVAEIQSAIALIRKHQTGTRTAVQQFVAGQAETTGATTASGRTHHAQRYAPGTILDAPGGVEYDFPAAGLDAANYVKVLQAELRAIASRLVMPEFMLTSDASNANYASTLVAEGPAVKMFERLQADQTAADLAVMWRVVAGSIAAGKLHADASKLVEIQAAAPALAVRDALRDAQVRRMQHDSGILSPQTWSQLSDLDYDQEQANRRQHAAPAPAAIRDNDRP